MKTNYLLTNPDYLPHIKRYESDEDLMKNTLEGDGFKCPHCGHSPRTLSDSIIGIAPITTTLDKYPNKNFDMAYIWLEKYKCPVCKTKFYIENGT